MPGAGWIGLDATSGLLCGEGHMPLAATPHYGAAAPISGLARPLRDHVQSRDERDAGSPRRRASPCPSRTRPGAALDALGEQVDRDLAAGDVRLTTGGEPTFVSIDDFEAPEWNAEARRARPSAASPTR